MPRTQNTMNLEPRQLRQMSMDRTENLQQTRRPPKQGEPRATGQLATRHITTVTYVKRCRPVLGPELCAPRFHNCLEAIMDDDKLDARKAKTARPTEDPIASRDGQNAGNLSKREREITLPQL